MRSMVEGAVPPNRPELGSQPAPAARSNGLFSRSCGSRSFGAHALSIAESSLFKALRRQFHRTRTGGPRGTDTSAAMRHEPSVRREGPGRKQDPASELLSSRGTTRLPLPSW